MCTGICCYKCRRRPGLRKAACCTRLRSSRQQRFTRNSGASRTRVTAPQRGAVMLTSAACLVKRTRRQTFAGGSLTAALQTCMLCGPKSTSGSALLSSFSKTHQRLDLQYSLQVNPNQSPETDTEAASHAPEYLNPGPLSLAAKANTPG